MSLTDSLLLTLLNTVICLALPKLLSIIIAANTESNTSSESALTSQ